MGHFATKWNITLTYKYQIHYRTSWLDSQNVREFDIYKSLICPIWGQTETLLSQILYPCNEYCVRVLLRISIAIFYVNIIVLVTYIMFHFNLRNWPPRFPLYVVCPTANRVCFHRTLLSVCLSISLSVLCLLSGTIHNVMLQNDMHEVSYHFHVYMFVNIIFQVCLCCVFVLCVYVVC